MSLPKHVALIPDGNRRWARAQRLNPWEGHLEGVKRFWELGFASLDWGIPHTTFWGGSYDNLRKRSAIEVSFLFQILSNELSKPDILNSCLERQVRFRVFGEWADFSKDKSLIDKVKKLEEQTEHFAERSLTILFGYDGQREMLSAINSLVKAGEDVSKEILQSALWTGSLPEVDFVIRTGGEPHWSAGFMMWLTANSQFYFTDLLWPDFKKDEFKKALDDYESRERRLGK